MPPPLHAASCVQLVDMRALGLRGRTGHLITLHADAKPDVTDAGARDCNAPRGPLLRRQ